MTIEKRIAVVGSGQSQDPELLKLAYRLGAALAKKGCLLYSGGRAGVMESASRGAVEQGGITVGILPGNSISQSNPFIRVPVLSNMGHARNAILVQSVDAVIALDGEMGTLSEIALALKNGIKVISLGAWDLPGIVRADSLEQAVELAIED